MARESPPIREAVRCRLPPSSFPPSKRPHAHRRLRPFLPLRRTHRDPPGFRRRASGPRHPRIDRQELRRPRHLGADGNPSRHRSGRGQAGVLGRRQHPCDRGRRLRREPVFPAYAGHAIRPGPGHDARARHARLLHLPADQPGRRRMGACRQAEIHPLQHAAVPARRGRHRGPDRRGHRRRRPHPADARARCQRSVEGASRTSPAS